MHSVGANREIKIEYQIQYINIPANVKINSKLPRTISVNVVDGIKSIFDYFWVSDLDTLTIDLNDINQSIKSGRKTFDMEAIIAHSIREDFGEEAFAKTFAPRTLSVEYITLSSKKIPVLWRANVNIDANFMLSDSIRIKPNEVTVFGSKELLDTISYLPITSIDEDTLSETTELEYRLDKNKEGLSFEPRGIFIRIPIDKKVEKTIELPISTKNNPSGLMMNTFPRTVSVVCAVPLSRFSQIYTDDFSAEIDYQKRTTEGRCPVIISKKPFWTTILRLEPQEVEYSLEKTDK